MLAIFKRWWNALRGRPTSTPSDNGLPDTDTENMPLGADSDETDALDEPKDADDVDDLVEIMFRHDRYALLMRPQIAQNLEVDQIARAQQMLEEKMALVPEGQVYLRPPQHSTSDDEELSGGGGGRIVSVEAALLDRYPVTNAQFKRFVDAGGYDEMALWDEEIWQGLFHFVDQTGLSGPRFWKDGTYPSGQAKHPVVGVSWYEAQAYSRWVGKRLPTDPEWVKAGAWPMPVHGGPPAQRRYPWGDAWEPHRANVWASGLGKTCPVTDFSDGVSVAGVYDLVGNVWEWTADSYGIWHEEHGAEHEHSLKSLRGGAFNTYFESQATCQFQSGDSALARKHNIGFRCALGICDLMHAGGLLGHDEPASEEISYDPVQHLEKEAVL